MGKGLFLKKAQIVRQIIGGFYYIKIKDNCSQWKKLIESTMVKNICSI